MGWKQWDRFCSRFAEAFPWKLNLTMSNPFVMAGLCKWKSRAKTFPGMPVAAFTAKRAGAYGKGTSHSLQGEDGAGYPPCYTTACFYTQRWCLGLAPTAAFQFVLGNTSGRGEGSQHSDRHMDPQFAPRYALPSRLQRHLHAKSQKSGKGYGQSNCSTKKGDSLKGNSSLMCNPAEILYFLPTKVLITISIIEPTEHTFNSNSAWKKTATFLFLNQTPQSSFHQQPALLLQFLIHPAHNSTLLQL